MGGIDMGKLMYGENAVHVPMWMVVQDAGNAVSFVGASQNTSLRFGSKLTHQLVIGEFVIRPHVVVESEHGKGSGLSGMITRDPKDFFEYGKVILDPMGIAKDYR